MYQQPITSPHLSVAQDTGAIMRLVLLATLPGVATITWFFGWGTVINIVWASLVALAAEALVLKLRKRPVGFYLGDCSALVTAFLLAISIPPYAPWWLVLVGTGVAIIIAKQLYGGLGYNPFNPAMVGYVVLLISFPVEMTSWAAPAGSVANQPDTLGPIQAIYANFPWLAPQPVDAFTTATPLDVFKQNDTQMVSELWDSEPQFGAVGGYAWEWVNLAFLAGGLFLLYRRVFTWHAPISMLMALALMAALFYDAGSAGSKGSPLFHLFTGAAMFGAFFIVTDPVSSAVSNRGRLIYGAGIGVLVFLIRSYGDYPDAVAFAVLLMNFAAPLIDYYTQPRTYGHRSAQK